jgi:NADPH:quinone reductase-like Zn-dependent oxidoreductase
MKAVICTQYGPPEVLKIQEVDTPTPKANQLRIKVVSSAVNSGDVRVRGLKVQGILKLIMQVVLGFSKPRKPILGTVFSGVVDAVGNNVTKFHIGDSVFGMTGFAFGTHAEYLIIKENSTVMPMPANATYQEAAALVFGGHTAIDFLDNTKRADTPNKKVLIIGATGSVGVAAIQIAKQYTNDITAVCNTDGQHLVRALEINNIIVYNKEDFTKRTEKFDIIFDAVGYTSKQQCKSLLNKNGVYKNVNLGYVSENIKQLQQLKTLFEKGALKAVIDKTFSLDEIVEAHRYVDTGRKKGNVILNIRDGVG